MTDVVAGSAPGRVNLIGEHTDYNGGFALPLALPQRTVATVRPRDGGTVTATSSLPGSRPVTFGTDTVPGDVSGWGAYVAGVFWSLRQAGHDVPGADVHIDSDVASGAGLSSSAALECAVAVALDWVAGLNLDRTTLALLCQRAENGYVGAPTGLMDQMAAIHGLDDHVVLFDAARVTAEPVPCDLAGAGLALLVVDTRAPHRHVDGEYGERRRTCEDAARRLAVSSLRDVQDQPVEDVLGQLDRDPFHAGEPAPVALPAGSTSLGTPSAQASNDTADVMRRRVRHVLTENERVRQTAQLLRAGRVREISQLLTASHASLRDDYEVTVPELDVAVDAALASGALGARMTGGGFGGSIVALMDADRVDVVTDAVRAAFARHGFSVPQAFATQPSRGASCP